MARIGNPVTFSTHFGVDPARLENLGVLDPTLAIDTKLFIDPLLLEHSQHVEISESGRRQYREHFTRVIRFLELTAAHNDVAWRSARRLLTFHEVPGTGLGYGANTIRGSAFGEQLTNKLLVVGKEIVDLGVRDPDLFPAMALFEQGIGADRLSDMTTNVIRAALAEFNARILSELGLNGERFDLAGVDGVFLRNPYQRRPTPVVLVPTDVLRDLPIARDWDEIADAASKNSSLRDRVNAHIGEIWQARSRRSKATLRDQALSSAEAFETLLDALHGVSARSYDTRSDPEGLVKWTRVAAEYARRYPLQLAMVAPTLDSASAVVARIIDDFRHLIEQRGLNRELYRDDGRPRPEGTAQRLFFAVAYSHCKANNLDLSPEADTGSGRIDFKFSRGRDRVLVELKLSRNPNVVHGYETQLEVYRAAEQTIRAYYVVIDVGGMGRKDERLIAARNAARERGEPLSELEFIDGFRQESASKRGR